MKVAEKIVVVTGGAKGIGQALCDRFHREGAKKVIVADIDIANASVVAEAVDGAAYLCDVTKEADIKHLMTTLRASTARSNCSAQMPERQSASTC